MYYINPWWFYLVGIADSVSLASALLMIIFGIVIACTIALWIGCKADEEEEGAKGWKRLTKLFLIPFIISVVLTIFVPSRQTCYQMLIASQVTVENVNGVKETVKEVADYIIEASDKLSGDSENGES